MVCDIDEDKAHKAKGAKFFTDWNEMVKDPLFQEVDYVAICTPNHLHYPMAKALYNKKVILEKPPTINVAEAEDLVGNDISCVVQLRYNPYLAKLRARIEKSDNVEMSICVHRDEDYMNSWKNDIDRSGGLLFNIGVHYFDLVSWMFGHYLDGKITTNKPKYCDGVIELERARVKWQLSIDQPRDNQFRYLRIDGEDVDLTKNFEGLHTRAYEQILKGNSVKIEDILPTIQLIENLYATG